MEDSLEAVKNPVVATPVQDSSQKNDNPSPASTNTEKSQTNSSKKAIPWKFKMNHDLSNAEISRLPTEEILASWRFNATSMSQTEWIASFLTCGLYYVCTRILLKRNRNYAVHVTEKSVFVKEEMFESRLSCTSMLMENQVTFPLHSLAYVCVEETKSRFCGLMPATVALEMRFGRYPKDSEVPSTTYQSVFQIFLKPFSDASCYALKNAFGIDFDSNPITLATQIMAAIPQMTSLHGWIIFGAYFAYSLLQQLYKGIYEMLKAALLDPSIGPRMVIGVQDATSFRLEADISEDPECRSHLKNILQKLLKHLPDRQVLRETLKPRVRGSITRVREGDAPRQLNNKKTYEQGDEYILLEDFLYLPETETIYDVCQSNPYITSSDWKRVIFTLGLYYFTDLAGHIAHRKNIFFTRLRCIHHSVLLSAITGEVEHSRLEYWVNDQLTNLAVVDFKKKSSFRANAMNLGWITFEMTRSNKACMMFIFRSMFRARYEPLRTPGLTYMNREEWRNDDRLKDSILTACAFTDSENIDVAVYSKQYLFTLVEYILGCCCLLKVPEASVTATDETLYLEQYTNSCFSSTRIFVCLPWCDVDGIYWQNFDARGPTSLMYCCGLCVLCFFVPCLGFFACLVYCCSCCSSAPENYDTYDDFSYGQKGARLRICAAKNASFLMGINLPTKFYGIRDAIVDSLIDSIVSRSLKAKHEMTFQLHGEGNRSHLNSLSSHGIKNFTGNTVGSPMAGFHQFTEQITSDRVASMLQQPQSSGSFTPPSAASLKAVSPSSPPPPPQNLILESQQPMVITAQPIDSHVDSPIIAQGYVIQAAPSIQGVSSPMIRGEVIQTINPGPVHFTQYNTQKSRTMNQYTPGIALKNLRFPMNPPNPSTCQSLMAGEVFLGGWRFETSLLETWQLVYYILTMGIGFFIHMLLHQYRTFTSFYVTQDRILIQEEVWNQEYCCTNRIMEDEVSFMISDISYINVVEIGPRWCGCIPARTWLEIRFGQHPPVTEDPPGLGSFPSLSGKSSTSIFTKARAYAMAAVYGIKEMDKPPDAMHAYLAMARSTGILNLLINEIHFYLQFASSLFMSFLDILKRVLIWCIFGSQTEDHAVGPKLVDGTLNGRRHFVGFQTSHAPHMVKEFVQLVTQLNASKVAPMEPSVELPALSPGNRFNFTGENSDNSLFQTINDTNTYLKNGGDSNGKEFHVIQRLWNLLQDEIVYDVTPFNPKLIWTCNVIWNVISTAGLYYVFVIWPNLQFKKSYMITNRRLVRHITRTTSCLVKFSQLQMWFLSPINSYTLVEKQGSCCRKDQLEFIVDSSRFGPFTFFIRNPEFMKNVLKVLSGGMKEYFTPLNQMKQSSQAPLTRNDLIQLPQAGRECFTNEFISDAETIECVTGVTLPISWIQQHLCCHKPIHLILTLTNTAIYLECHSGKLRLFTCLPWRQVGGIYWSNYQPYSKICFWMNSFTYATKLYGHAGAQLHFNTKKSNSFSLGVQLPHRYYGVDTVINDLVTTMQTRIHGEATDEEEK